MSETTREERTPTLYLRSQAYRRHEGGGWLRRSPLTGDWIPSRIDYDALDRIAELESALSASERALEEAREALREMTRLVTEHHSLHAIARAYESTDMTCEVCAAHGGLAFFERAARAALSSSRVVGTNETET